MSKIFDALNQKKGQVPDLVFSTFGDRLKTAVMPSESAPPPPNRPIEVVALEPSTSMRTVPLSIPINSPLFPFDGEHWSAGEQYRLARTKIYQSPTQLRSIVVSSSSPADGKTLTAINLAAALAFDGESRVLLVDADLRLSALHNRVGISASPGLAEVLSGAASPNEAIVHAQQFPNLYLLPAGHTVKNPTELLGSSRWRALCKELAASYDYVVFDSPPIGVVADFELLRSVCDGVLIVVRPDHTPRKALFKALEAIPKEKLIGVILNSIPKWFLTPEYHYSEYAGYYAKKD